MKESMEDVGYKFLFWLVKDETAVFQEFGGNKEVWFINDFHASYGFSYLNHDWEFVSEYRGE